MRFFVLFFCIAISAAFQGASQPVLTSASIAPNPGDKIYYYTTDYYPAGNAGANQVWNFAGIKSNNSFVATVNACPAGHCSDFPGSTVGNFSQNDESYYYSDTNSLLLTGSWDYTTVAKKKSYLDPILILKFPFSYGDSFVDSFRSYQTIIKGSLQRSGSDSTIADAWGSLTDKWGATYYNVLRVKRILTSQEKLTDTNHVVTYYQSKEVSYIWYLPGYHEFLIYMTTFNSNFPGWAPLSTYGAYSMMDGGIVAVPGVKAASVGILENPVHTSLCLQLASGARDVSYSIIDALGKTVQQGYWPAARGSMLDLPIADLPTGVYCLKLGGRDTRDVYRFMKD